LTSLNQNSVTISRVQIVWLESRSFILSTERLDRSSTLLRRRSGRTSDTEAVARDARNVAVEAPSEIVNGLLRVGPRLRLRVPRRQRRSDLRLRVGL
jgi:hypothetical protein